MFDMEPYELYTFCVCMVVYVLLTALFVGLFSYITIMLVKQIRAGLEDEKILAEADRHAEDNKAYKRRRAGLFDILITAVFCCLIFSAFGMSVYMGVKGEQPSQDGALFRVVLSDSMSEKNAQNKYLFENELDNQFQQFDLILTQKMPAENELELYDIVVYKLEDAFIVHRIVGIEEANEKHPDGRRFVLQGDAVATNDRLLVSYSQMVGIYEGQKVPFVGSFILFLQSPAGYMCILLVVLGVITIPLMEGKILREKLKRLHLLRTGMFDGNGKFIGLASRAQGRESYSYDYPDYIE